MGGGSGNLRDPLNGKDSQVRRPGNQTRKLLTVRRGEDLEGEEEEDPQAEAFGTELY